MDVGALLDGLWIWQRPALQRTLGSGARLPKQQTREPCPGGRHDSPGDRPDDLARNNAEDANDQEPEPDDHAEPPEQQAQARVGDGRERPCALDAVSAYHLRSKIRGKVAEAPYAVNMHYASRRATVRAPRH